MHSGRGNPTIRTSDLRSGRARQYKSGTDRSGDHRERTTSTEDKPAAQRPSEPASPGQTQFTNYRQLAPCGERSRQQKAAIVVIAPHPLRHRLTRNRCSSGMQRYSTPQGAMTFPH
jgi:hypothetical protein